MDSALLLGFRDELNAEEEAEATKSASSSSSSARRLVPWLNWDEWLFVKRALFSDSPHSVSSALTRISAWRCRGSLPVLIEITASIVQIHLHDPCFRQDQSNDASLSDEMLTMLYCMAIIRLVNGAVEKTRKRELVSIAVAADAIGIPRMLIDIRHEASHRELPSLNIVRNASVKALDWLKSYYWEPQSQAIPFQGEGNAKIKKEIKSKIRELAICLKVNGSAQSSSSLLKGKRVKHCELFFGRNKLLSLAVGRSQTSRSGGSKKHISKILKAILGSYSSFSTEIVSVLLEYLLKAISSAEFKENADDASVGLSVQDALADWKRIILKLSNKEPDLLLNLLKQILDMIETQKDDPSIVISHSRAEWQQSDYLSPLFAWLVGILGKASSAAANMPKRVLLELFRKCLLISQLCNKQLVDSALRLAELMGDRYLLEKVQKLSLITLSNFDNADDESSLLTSKNIVQFEESILEAAKKLELIKQQIMKSKNLMPMDCETKSQTWTLARSWNPCPIGMLPRAVGPSGCLPILDIIDKEKQNQVSEKNENWKLVPHGAKRDAPLDLPPIDSSAVKKMRETKECGELNNGLPTEGEKGCLMVGGVWKKITEDELLAIESSVRILV